MITEKQKQLLTSAIIKNPRLMCEEVLGQNIHTGTLTLPLVYPESEKGNTATIPFVMVDDFGFSLGNTWNKVLPDLATEFIQNNLLTWYNSLTSMGLLDENERHDSQVSFQSKLAETANYRNSNKPKFSVRMMFVCTQRSYNPSEIIKTLSSMALPLKFNTSMSETLTGVIDGTATAVSDLKGLAKSIVSDVKNANAKKDKVKGVDSFKDTTVYKTLKDVVSSDVDTFKKTSAGLGDRIISYTQENMPQSSGTLGQMGSQISKFGVETLDSLKAMSSKIADAINESIMMAPLYYQAVYDEQTHTVKGKSGTMTLQIGSWFRATDLICTDISGIKFSKETIAPPPEWLGLTSGSNVYTPTKDSSEWGFPVYAECTVTLEPCTIINYQDFCNYFIQSTPKPVTKAADSAFSYLGQKFLQI